MYTPDLLETRRPDPSIWRTSKPGRSFVRLAVRSPLLAILLFDHTLQVVINLRTNLHGVPKGGRTFVQTEYRAGGAGGPREYRM